ncbi:porin [Pinibacter aurantiacus]|uniref:OprO/OprP family phosphate-selective porin n=1 Tax=Pinibacter aurantiacus TaxID=2851599 RepID=A0A9E2SBI0_9BACT|nr:porin [Pinibacter aurantiacus]MBV4358378.1 OprO/OprP family phosphate-selective porin [Pinibacter aurantiacus]
MNQCAVLKQRLKVLFTITVIVAFFRQPLYAQEKKDTCSNYSAIKRAITFNALLQMRYTASLTHNVDVSGKNFDPAVSKGVINTFSLRRARLMVKAAVNDRFSTNFMLNFAEFCGNTANKVVENAFIKYSANKHFNIQAGQFRPFFGIEDLIPAELIRTLDYSNQYTAFAASGWQGFQLGVSVFGNITGDDTKFVKYYAGIYNGNNRNQPSDNDNTKNIYGRLETSMSENFKMGVNAASGSFGAGTGFAWGGDVTGKINLGADKKWELFLTAEGKTGTNFNLYNAATSIKPQLNDCKMWGVYFFPLLRYNYNHPRLRALEFSSRYEYLNENAKLGDNPYQTITPNISFLFADDMYAALQVGTNIELFKHNVPLTNSYSQSLMYLQLQLRF